MLYLPLQYARQHLVSFMFRHGYYNDACVLFFPPNAVPPPPQPSSMGVLATSSSSPQRPDSLATDYGTIDDLCELCIGYGAMSVLEEVISTRMSSANPQDLAANQYTAAALVRICIYCETHKHFNYLYRFQVNFLYHIFLNGTEKLIICTMLIGHETRPVVLGRRLLLDSIFSPLLPPNKKVGLGGINR